MDRPNLAPLRRGFFCGRAQLWYCLDGFAGCRNSASLFGRTWRGFFCDLPRAVQPSVSRPVDWAGLLVTFVEWVTALCVGKHKWPASLLIDVQNCAIALVGLPPRGKPLLEELSPAPARLFRASVPLALCNRFCGSVLVWAAFPPPFSAAHMADLAPLRRGFSVAGRCATNGAARRWVVGLLCLRRDRQPCAIMRPKLSPASPGLFVCSRMVLGRNADTETKRAARR
jgi:hypothetical protein